MLVEGLPMNAFRACALMLLLIFSIPGCEKKASPLPETFSVKGKVIDQDGKPMTKGTIYFSPATNVDTGLLINGPIENGDFTLATRRVIGDFQESDGVPAGEYRVTIRPPVGPSHTMPSIPWSTTVNVRQGDNVFTFKIKR
jgi:hypothetical protein